MTPKHYIYHVDHAPIELLNKFPYAARYAPIILFVEGMEIVTGVAPAGIVNLAAIPFNPPFDSEAQGLTYAQFDAMVDSLLSTDTPFTNDEVQISKTQTEYLYNTRFKPEGGDI
tara:strand:- start:41 stop:382 length:342 start_codon:yes stop_codon:yes gene_type:complete